MIVFLQLSLEKKKCPKENSIYFSPQYMLSIERATRTFPNNQKAHFSISFFFYSFMNIFVNFLKRLFSSGMHLHRVVQKEKNKEIIVSRDLNNNQQMLNMSKFS